MCHLKFVHHYVCVKVTDSIVVGCPANAAAFTTFEEPRTLPDNLTQELGYHIFTFWYT